MDTNEMIALLLPPNGCYKCSDTRKEIAEELARRAAAQPVAWATPSLLVTLSAVEKNHLTNPDRRTRGGEFESAARDAERYSVPLYAAPPAQAEPQPAPTPNPGPIGSSLGVAAPDVAALVERLNDVLRNWTNVSDDEQSLIRDARAALTAQQARIDALADSDKYDGDRNELHEVAIAAARLALEHAAQVCHCYAVDQRIHSLAGKGAIHCRDAIRAEAAKIGADA